MKIDTPLTTDLGLGSNRRMIEAQDSIVDIPSQITPVTNIIQPWNTIQSSSDIQRQSCLTEYLVSKNNTTAWTDTVATLAAGLWTISIQFTIAFTCTTALALAQRIRITISDPNFSVTLVWHPLAAVTNSLFSNQTIHRVLSRDQTLIQLNGPATAAGDTIITQAAFVFQREL